MDRKVLLDVLRKRHGRREILVFESHDEAGFEVPKGSVEPGETLVEAVRRELREEAGLNTANKPEPIGTTIWRDEEQTFFRVDGSDTRLPEPGSMPASFAGASGCPWTRTWEAASCRGAARSPTACWTASRR